jgi:hypothetical protein
MIENLSLIAEPEKRSRTAQEIMRVMLTFNPAIREVPEFRRKLWEQLFQIADYNLELNGPFPIPEKPEPEPNTRAAYHFRKCKYRQYGLNVELLVRRAMEMPDGPQREEMVLHIAQIMKQCLHFYQTGVPNDEVVFEHLAHLSDGMFTYSAEQFQLRNQYSQRTNNPNFRQNRSNNQNNNNRRSFTGNRNTTHNSNSGNSGQNNNNYQGSFRPNRDRKKPR